MTEYISFDIAKKCDKLSINYGIYCNKNTNKVWNYPESSNGSHASSPSIKDREDLYEDEYEGEVWSAFSWKELFELMNKVVEGDFRKSEFECIEDINQFALELNKYIKENKPRRSGIYAY